MPNPSPYVLIAFIARDIALVGALEQQLHAQAHAQQRRPCQPPINDIRTR